VFSCIRFFFLFCEVFIVFLIIILPNCYIHGFIFIPSFDFPFHPPSLSFYLDFGFSFFLCFPSRPFLNFYFVMNYHIHFYMTQRTQCLPHMQFYFLFLYSYSAPTQYTISNPTIQCNSYSTKYVFVSTLDF
jgi:hypothetical protein